MNLKTKVMKLTTLNVKNILILICAHIFLTSCTTEVEDISDNDLLNSESSFEATPVVGNIYTITNLESGRTLDIQAASNSNGANLQVWGKNRNTGATHRQWEIISVGSGYVRLKGVDSGKSLEVSAGNNSNGANVQQWTYQGTTHQQWEIISVGDGYFRLKNRDSGKSLRATGTSNGSNIDQWSYRALDSQKWLFTQIGDLVSTPPVEGPTEEGEGESSFINTNDGVFTLNDFQIESSSHLSSSTSTKTTSWSYNDSTLLGTEWYEINRGDYYLKSASNEGKRTEWKEYPGKESSLSVNKVMKYEASIIDIPENGVTVAQVHNRGGVNRPFLRVYIENGRINVKQTTNDLTNSSGTYNTDVGPSISEASEFKVQLTIGNGKVNVKIESPNGTLDEDYSPNTGGNYNDYRNDFYFKAGVYTEGDDTEPTIRFLSFEKS